MKRKLKRFWKEWGITWEEFIDLLGAISVIVLVFELHIILSVL